MLSALFCAFFAWKSWTLLHEAWTGGLCQRHRLGAAALDPLLSMSVGMTLLTVQIILQAFQPLPRPHRRPSNLYESFTLGLLYGGVTLLVMFSGMPIAFALGLVATIFMVFFMPRSALDTVTQNVYEEMSSITLLSIPLFILKGAAIGRSPAGRDLYSALHVWMSRIPGGLGIANVFACALFAAMAGSSPATCSAIGSAGIPGDAQARLSRRLRGWPDCRRRHARHPAAALDHHDPLCRRRRSSRSAGCSWPVSARRCCW